MTDTTNDITKKLLEKEAKIVKNLFPQVIRVIKAGRYKIAIFDNRETRLRFWEWDSQFKNVKEMEPKEYKPAELVPDYLLLSKEAVLKAARPEFEQWLNDSGRSYENEYPQSWLAAPIVAGGQGLGIIILEDFDRENAFDQRDQSILLAMAQRSAEALAKVQLRAGLDAAIEMGKDLTSRIQETVNEVLDLTYDHLHKLMDTRDMYIALYDENEGQLEFPLYYENRVEKDWPAAPMDLKDRENWTLTKEVFATRRSLNVPDFATWYVENDYPLPEAKPYPKSWLGVPLVSRDKALGIISFQNDEIEGAFGPDDVEVLEIMAGQAAVAFENARLYQDLETRNQELKQRNHQLRYVNDVAQKLASNVNLDEDEILDLIHQTTSGLMDTRNMFIALYDKNQSLLEFRLFYLDGVKGNWPADPMDLTDRKNWTLTKEVFDTRESLNVSDFEWWYVESGYPLPKAKPYPKSWLGVPLVSGDNVLGIISLQNDEIEGAFRSDDVEVLEIMAGQAAVALDNARLYETLEQRVQERTQQLAGLQEISVKIASQLDLFEVLSSVGENTNELLDADFSTLFTYNARSERFEEGLQIWPTGTEKPSIPKSDGTSAEIIKGGQSIYVNNVDTQVGFVPRIVGEKEVKSFAAVPLIIRNDPVGLLYVNYSRATNFSNEEKELIHMLANLSATVIQNANLVEEQKRFAQREQLNLLSSVAAEYTHRMNNLAGTIPARIELARDHLDKNDPKQAFVIKMLDRLDAESRFLLEAAERIKKSTQKQVPEFIDVNQLLDIASRQVFQQLDADERIDLKKEFYPGIPLVSAEPHKIEDVFVNMIRNAVQAIPEKGEVSIATRHKKDDSRYIEVDIIDTGIGIPAENLPNIFDLYFTTKKSEGLGYGLWRDRTYIREMGGDIKVKTQVGKGTTFTILLPVGG